MPGKKLQCAYCSKVMRSDNLKRHVKVSHLKNSRAVPSLEENKLAGKKRSLVFDDDIARVDGIKIGSGKFETGDNNQSRNPEIQNEIPSKRRTKADIIGYSDASDTSEDDNTESKPTFNDDDASSSSSSSSSSSRDDKEPAEVDTDNEEEDDEVKKIINSTVDYVIAHDKKELTELLTVLKEEANEEYIDTLLELEEHIATFITDEFLEEKPILPMIHELIRKLENSPVAKSKWHRLKMLVNDVNKNRYRVKSIFTRLEDDMGDKDDALPILQALVREELLSEEQYEKLTKMENMDLPAIAQIINDTKVGRGLPFLPRKVSDLRNSLHSLLTGIAEGGNSVIRNILSAVLEELRRLRAISDEQYIVIKKDNDIM